MRAPERGDALIVVDVQYDFLPGGALGVRDGDRLIAPLNRLIERWQARDLPVVYSRDWHPPRHCSFTAQGGPWPEHCVAGTRGAAFASSLRMPADARVISKATSPSRDAYSAFDGTGLAEILEKLHVTRIFIGGLATDYCVRATGADARAKGLDVVVLEDAVCAVDVQPGDGPRALAELVASGAQLASTGEVLAAMADPA